MYSITSISDLVGVNLEKINRSLKNFENQTINLRLLLIPINKGFSQTATYFNRFSP